MTDTSCATSDAEDKDWRLHACHGRGVVEYVESVTGTIDAARMTALQMLADDAADDFDPRGCTRVDIIECTSDPCGTAYTWMETVRRPRVRTRSIARR